MPCYCDEPNENDQVTIEKRAKVRMYFDIQNLMTPEQAYECEKQKISQFPLPDPNTALCKICKIMNKEQMEKVSAYYYQIKWQHKTLYDWYIKHCEDDKRNEK